MAYEVEVTNSKDKVKSDYVKRRYDELLSDRQPWHQVWQEVTDYIYPKTTDFLRSEGVPGKKRNTRIYDSTALVAHQAFSSGIQSFVTSPTDMWFELEPGFKFALQDRKIKEYLEFATEILYKVFRTPSFKFYARAHELYQEAGALGTGVFLTEDTTTTIKFSTIDLAKCFLAENSEGRIDFVIRREPYTGRQLLEEFPNIDTELKEKIEKKMKGEGNAANWNVLHCVMPRTERNVESKMATNLPYASLYVLEEECYLLKEGGYHEFPYQFLRLDSHAEEVYGRSPAMTALPDVRTLNELRKLNINAVQKAVAPPLMVPMDTFPKGINTAPNALNYYRQGYAKQELIRPIEMGNNVQLGFATEAELKASIKEAFHVDMFLDTKSERMSATESLQREESRMRLMAPQMGRMHSDFIQPLIMRVFNICVRMGIIPAVPDELKQVGFQPQYVSPLARSQKQLQAAGLGKAIQDLIGYASVDPSVLDYINGDGVAKTILAAHAAPSTAFRSDEEVAKIRQGRQQQQQQMQGVESANTSADTIKKLADAMKSGQGQGFIA